MVAQNVNVIPAKAGIQAVVAVYNWIPAFARMTVEEIS